MFVNAPSASGGDYTPPSDGLYNVVVTEVQEVDKNPQYWKDPEKPEYQLQWTLKIMDEGDFKGQTLTLWSGNAIGRHPKNKLTNLCKAIDPSFSIDVAYKDEQDFLNHVLYRPLQVVTKLGDPKTKVVDGEEKTVQYAKVETFLPASNKGEDMSDNEDVVAMLSELGEVTVKEQPF